MHAIRGLIFEELVLKLLEKVGYRVVRAGEEGTRQGHSGQEVGGRGEWHQIDAIAAYDFTPAFIYPLRLLLEAKCYAKPVGIEVVRNSVGVLKDISENYFTSYTSEGINGLQNTQRFNYLSAIFSTSGYSKCAQRFAIAHQIYLIQYRRAFLFKNISEGLQKLEKDFFNGAALGKPGAHKKIRQYVREKLNEGGEIKEENPFTEEGSKFFEERILQPLQMINGSYVGMLQGKWPMHLLSNQTLPAELFKNTDTLKCRVYGEKSQNWSFVPLTGKEGDREWFRLDFDLPDEVAELVQKAQGDKLEVARTKEQNFSFICISGIIGGIRRQIRLELDEDWIANYIQRAQKRRGNNHERSRDQGRVY